MDIEKTIEFILAQQASAEERHAKADEQLAAMRAQMAAMREQMAADEAKANQELAAIRTILAETAQIQRAQARTLVTLENGMTRLTAAQEITEQKLQSFIDSLRRGRNGNPNPE